MMPSKGKTASKLKATEGCKAVVTSHWKENKPEAPKTVNERSSQRHAASRPFDVLADTKGLGSLSLQEQSAWLLSRIARSERSYSYHTAAGAKAHKELWRSINEASLPLRSVAPLQKGQWGTDRYDRDVGELSPIQFEERRAKQARLTQLLAESQGFRVRRERASFSEADANDALTDIAFEQEKNRRREIAALGKELYGEKTAARMGTFASDPNWDNVVPIPQEEPEAALAAIAYPDEYSEAVSYLRAVMAKNELSHRCLDLTHVVIAMNPAHYTVWLYRAAIVLALGIPLHDEIRWLNDVSLEHLKNYQIWHHRHLLVEHYTPFLKEEGPEAVAAFVVSERAFMAQMLEQDTKNYHVWCYRSWLVRQLDMWGGAEELAAIQDLIDDDVRNNSAWSHRFFVAFSDPRYATPGSAATEHDPAVPADVVEREVAYAQAKTRLAPQNQSPWNYLRGALVKGGRPLASVESFVHEFVRNVGDPEREDVRSTHALDLLAEIYAENGDMEAADLCLRRLAEKWDRIRVGYWAWRRKCLEAKR